MMGNTAMLPQASDALLPRCPTNTWTEHVAVRIAAGDPHGGAARCTQPVLRRGFAIGDSWRISQQAGLNRMPNGVDMDSLKFSC
jgi:hypothetical protein